MSGIATQIIWGYIKKSRSYIAFYAELYKNIWNVPRSYDLSDTTLSIRLIRYTVLTSAMFLLVMYVTSKFTDNWYARSAAHLDSLVFCFAAWLFVYGFAFELYLANKIYPKAKVTFRECAALAYILFLQVFPFAALSVMVALHNPSDLLMLWDVGLRSMFQGVLSLTIAVTGWRHVMLILDANLRQALAVHLIMAGIGILLVITMWAATLALLLLPGWLQTRLLSIAIFVWDMVERLL